MKVFISWSGPTSRAVATVVEWWIGQILQAARPWMSDREIGVGDRSLSEIESGLRDAKFGIICVTPENQDAPWLNFEAGAISKEVGGEAAKVAPLLINMKKPTDLKGPLSQFQAVLANREGFDGIAHAINDALGDDKRAEGQLADALNTYWAQLEKKIDEAVKSAPSTPVGPSRDVVEVVDEILERVRAIQRENEERSRYPYFPYSRDLSEMTSQSEFLEAETRKLARLDLEERYFKKKMIAEQQGKAEESLPEIKGVAQKLLGLDFQLIHAEVMRRFDHIVIRLIVDEMPPIPLIRRVQKELSNLFPVLNEIVFSDDLHPLPSYEG